MACMNMDINPRHGSLQTLSKMNMHKILLDGNKSAPILFTTNIGKEDFLSLEYLSLNHTPILEVKILM